MATLEALIKDFRISTYRERLVEHLFIADIMQAAWLAGERKVVVARAEIDAWGYDLLLSCDGKVQPVQLKSSAKVGRITVNKALFALGGFVVLAAPFVVPENTVRLRYRIFRASPENAVGLLPANYTRWTRDKKGRAIRKPRPGHCKIQRSKFSREVTARELFDELFR